MNEMDPVCRVCIFARSTRNRRRVTEANERANKRARVTTAATLLVAECGLLLRDAENPQIRWSTEPEEGG